VTPKERHDQVEGRQAVRELLRARRRPVHSISIATGQDKAAILDEIVELARAQGVSVRRVPPATLTAEARTSAPQGVVAQAAVVPTVPLDRLLAPDGGRAPFLLVLDGVTDPRNLGGLLRTAVGAGVTGAVLPRHRASPLTAAAVKAAAGAVEVLPLSVVAGVPAALARARSQGVWTIGLVPGAPPVWDVELAAEPLALVVGAEGSGLAKLTRARCDLLAGVPLTGPLESLNVGAAAAVALFEIARRRKVANVPM